MNSLKRYALAAFMAVASPVLAQDLTTEQKQANSRALADCKFAGFLDFAKMQTNEVENKPLSDAREEGIEAEARDIEQKMDELDINCMAKVFKVSHEDIPSYFDSRVAGGETVNTNMAAVDAFKNKYMDLANYNQIMESELPALMQKAMDLPSFQP